MFCIIIPSSSAGSPRQAPNAGPMQLIFDASGRYGGLVLPVVRGCRLLLEVLRRLLSGYWS
jgi:hypothetical protein